MPAFITDFGLARTAATGSRLTRTGEAMGTPGYMSPEQARGEIADLNATTDVWGLGCVLYELLAGRRAFEGDTPAAVIAQVIAAEPPRLATVRPDLPAGLAVVVEAALAKTAGRRPRSAREFGADLACILRGEAPARRPRPRGRMAAAAICAVAAAIVAAAWVGSGSSGGPPARPVSPPAPPPTAGQAAERAWTLRHVDPSQALAMLDAAVAADPGQHEWRIRRGLLRWAIGAPREMVRADWEAIPAHVPERAAARLYLGLEGVFSAMRTEADISTALADLRRAAQDGGTVGRLATAALAVYSRPPRWGEATATLRALTGWEAALLRAMVAGYGPAKDRQAELAAYDQALAEGIPMAWILFNRGSVRFDLGDVSGARADLDAAIALQPDFVAALSQRGRIRIEADDLAGGQADFEAVLARVPDHFDARLGWANARRLLGDARGALEAFDRLVALRPDDALVAASRGSVRVEVGDLEGAIADFDRAIARDAANPETRQERGRVHAMRGAYPAAIADLDAALAARPEWPTVLLNRGMAHEALGAYGAARRDFEAVVRLSPDDAEAHGALGQACVFLDDAVGARDAFRRCLALAPDSAIAPNVRRMLAQVEAHLAVAPPAVPPRAPAAR